jgi:alpha-galactosidase
MVAMNGSLGIGGNLNHWTDEEMKQSAQFVAYYKSIRPTIQRGRLYRLISPEDSAQTATEYVSQDGTQVVMFAFLQAQRFGSPFPAVRLQGLVADAKYKLKPIDDKLQTPGVVLSGSYLMDRGVDLGLAGDYDSTSFTLERVP